MREKPKQARNVWVVRRPSRQRRRQHDWASDFGRKNGGFPSWACFELSSSISTPREWRPSGHLTGSESCSPEKAGGGGSIPSRARFSELSDTHGIVVHKILSRVRWKEPGAGAAPHGRGQPLAQRTEILDRVYRSVEKAPGADRSDVTGAVPPRRSCPGSCSRPARCGSGRPCRAGRPGTHDWSPGM